MALWSGKFYLCNNRKLTEGNNTWWLTEIEASICKRRIQDLLLWESVTKAWMYLEVLLVRSSKDFLQRCQMQPMVLQLDSVEVYPVYRTNSILLVIRVLITRVTMLVKQTFMQTTYKLNLL